MCLSCESFLDSEVTFRIYLSSKQAISIFLAEHVEACHFSTKGNKANVPKLVLLTCCHVTQCCSTLDTSGLFILSVHLCSGAVRQQSDGGMNLVLFHFFCHKEAGEAIMPPVQCINLCPSLFKNNAINASHSLLLKAVAWWENLIYMIFVVAQINQPRVVRCLWIASLVFRTKAMRLK